jgi:hypothetical protein
VPVSRLRRHAVKHRKEVRFPASRERQRPEEFIYSLQSLTPAARQCTYKTVVDFADPRHFVSTTRRAYNRTIPLCKGQFSPHLVTFFRLDNRRLKPYLPPPIHSYRGFPFSSRRTGVHGQGNFIMARTVPMVGKPAIGRMYRGGSLLLFCLSLTGCFWQHLPFPYQEKEKDILEQVMKIGDVSKVANAEPIQVQGIGLVTGLNGTGGGNPPGDLRTRLEEELLKKRYKNVKQLLDSPDCAMVIVTALIPAGSRKGDPMDVIVSLPQNSKVTSLQGGYLQSCYLRNYDTTKQLNPEYKGSNRLLPGHVLARAQGPLMIGMDNEVGARQGRIWEGGVSNIDRPFFLVLNKDREFAKVANAVADRINSQFQDDIRKQKQVHRLKELLLLDEVKTQINHKFTQAILSDSTVAKAANKQFIYVNVPWEYRLNQKRYLRVLRLIPLKEAATERLAYRQKLRTMLLDSTDTVRAALRLEALGKESLAALKTGLESEHPMVRFCSAEAMTYLGSTAGASELAKIAAEHPQLRSYCLTALASLDESVCHMELRELLASNNSEIRYGAFRALQILEDQDPQIAGEELNESFHLHKVAPNSAPMIHYSLHRRAEVVLFGQDTRFVAPFRIVAGKEFTITAEPNDKYCTITRYLLNEGRPITAQCSFGTEEVLRKMAEMGASYLTVVDLLRQSHEFRHLNCTVAVNAIPQPVPVEKLAELAREPNFLRTPVTPQIAGRVQDLRLNEEAEAIGEQP